MVRPGVPAAYGLIQFTVDMRSAIYCIAESDARKDIDSMPAIVKLQYSTGHSQSNIAVPAEYQFTHVVHLLFHKPSDQNEHLVLWQYAAVVLPPNVGEKGPAQGCCKPNGNIILNW